MTFDQQVMQGLREAGLTDKEAEFYLTTLSLREPTVAEVARTLGVSRTGGYDLAAALQTAGLVQIVDSDRVSHRAGTKVLRAADPQVLVARARERQLRLEQLMPKLRDLSSNNEPHAQYFQGLNAMRVALLDVLNWQCQLAGILSMRDLHETVGRETMDTFITERSRLGMGLRVIRSPERDEDSLWPTSMTDRRVLRAAPLGYVYTASMYIGDENILILSTREEGFALKITSRQFSLMQQHIFDVVWEMSTPV